MKNIQDIEEFSKRISYSEHYESDEYILRHVVIPKEMVAFLPENRLMSEDEWRSLGIQQSMGWEHYMIHKPEPHILLFRKRKY